MKLGDYPLEVVQFSCGKSLRNGRYKKSSLIKKHTADIPLPDVRSHIAGNCERMLSKAGTNACAISYPGLSRGISSKLMSWRCA